MTERISGLLYGYIVNNVFGKHDWVNLAEINPAWIYAVVCLVVLFMLLATVLYGIRFRTARIYNWNGRSYCYLGRAILNRDGGGYRIQIGERLADLSYTTLYRICLSGPFIRKNKYADMMLCAGHSRCLLHVEECMMQSIYYK